jgi:hypothetical protein
MILHLVKEAKQAAGSNVRCEWIRSKLNLADVLTRMSKLCMPLELTNSYRRLLEIYKQPFSYYGGDLDRLQKTLCDHRSNEVQRQIEIFPEK